MSRTSVRAGIGLLLGLTLGPTAAAQALTGPWRFETAVINVNCKLSGDLQISKVRADGAFLCSFVAVQSCASEPAVEITVKQSCKVTRVGAKIAIASAVDKIVSVKPAELAETVQRRYAPDNFSVTINPAGTEMRGMFHSIAEAPVRFWRPHADLVS